MKNLLATTAATVPALFTGAALAQTGNMMNGGMGGSGWMVGYGGYWVPVLLVVLVGLAAWIVMHKRK